MIRKALHAAALLLSLTLAATATAQTAADIEAVRANAHPVTGAPEDYDALLQAVGDRRIVFLGEATHGTAEFYRERMRVTQRLIVDKGLRAVAFEAEWRDMLRVDAYVRGASADTLNDALAGFTGFPVWMWRNAEFAAFVQWVRNYNAALPAYEPKVRFYGLDLYGIFESIDALEAYLDAADPAAAQRARERYRCLEQYRADIEVYVRAARAGADCRAATGDMFVELRDRYDDATRNGGTDEALFNAMQDARVASNGEAFYRLGGSWNARDAHMFETLEATMAFLEQSAPPARMSVWAHNTHAGDARATDAPLRGEWNVAQLARQRWPGDTLHVGFTTYNGTVMAASNWGLAGQVMTLRPAVSGSDATLFHATGIPSFYVVSAEPAVRLALDAQRLQRAVGVVYAPQTELQSHYFYARIARQFDVVIHVETTHAVSAPVPEPRPRRRAAQTF